METEVVHTPNTGPGLQDDEGPLAISPRIIKKNGELESPNSYDSSRIITLTSLRIKYEAERVLRRQE